MKDNKAEKEELREEDYSRCNTCEYSTNTGISIYCPFIGCIKISPQ